MLWRKENQKEKPISFEINNGEKPEDLLMEIVGQFPFPFFVFIYGVCKKSGLYSAIMGSKQQLVTRKISKNKYKMAIRADNNILISLIKAEMITIYLPHASTSFEQFVHNCTNAAEFLFKKSNSFTDQKRSIMQGTCYLACTWFTKENRLLFHFDKMQGMEMMEKIKNSLEE